MKHLKIAISFLLLSILFSCVSKSEYRKLLLENGKQEFNNDKLKRSIDTQVDILDKVSALELETHSLSLNKNQLSRALDVQDAKVDSLVQVIHGLEQSLQEQKAQQKVVIKERIIVREDNYPLTELFERLESQFVSNTLGVEINQQAGFIALTIYNGLLFAKNSSKISDSGAALMQEVAGVLKSSPELNLNVVGHTDGDGLENYNWNLSVLRATRIVKTLGKYGMDQSKMMASGKGEFQPIASNDTESDKALNRRIEIIIYHNSKNKDKWITAGKM